MKLSRARALAKFIVPFLTFSRVFTPRRLLFSSAAKRDDESFVKSFFGCVIRVWLWVEWETVNNYRYVEIIKGMS